MISETDVEFAINNNNVVILKFTSEWCKSCKKYDSYLDDLNIKIISISADDNEDLVEDYEITTLPTLLIYKEKNLMEKIEGFVPKTDFMTKLTNLALINND
jgi:thioredoxin 1